MSYMVIISPAVSFDVNDRQPLNEDRTCFPFVEISTSLNHCLVLILNKNTIIRFKLMNIIASFILKNKLYIYIYWIMAVSITS